MLSLVLGALGDELVVYLQYQPGPEPFSLYAPVGVDHGQLHNIGGGALYGHIAGHALPEGAGVEV